MDGKGLREWDVFPHGNPLSISGAIGGASCDFYHHCEKDTNMLKAGGQNTHWFSISWARILLDGGGAVSQGGDRFP